MIALPTFRILVLVLLLASLTFSRDFNKDEVRIADSIINLIDETSSQIFTTTNRGRGLQPRYFVCHCENFDVSFEDGLKILQNYADYENRFRHILRSQNTDYDNWFFILGVNHVRTWLWGEVVEEIGERYAKISFMQTPSEEHNFADSVRAMIVIPFEEFILQWNLVALSDTSSRFCLTAAAVPARSVPQWLIRIALRRIIPRTLRAISD